MAKVYCKNCKHLKLDCSDYKQSVCLHQSAKHRITDKETDFYSPGEFTIAREYCQYKNSENDCEFFEDGESPLTLQMIISYTVRRLKFIRRVLRCRFAHTKKTK